MATFLIILGIIFAIAGFIGAVFMGGSLSFVSFIIGLFMFGLFCALGAIVQNQNRIADKLEKLIQK